MSRWIGFAVVAGLGLAGTTLGVVASQTFHLPGDAPRAGPVAAPAPAVLALASVEHPALADEAAAALSDPSSHLPAPVAAALRDASLSEDDIVLLARPVDGDALPALFAHREDKPMTLASTTKLVTALAALDTLGPQYRWRTRAYLDGRLHERVLYGDLRIVGGGDARLVSAELVEWFRQMRQRGLEEIRGNIVLDRQMFQLTEADHANTPSPSAAHPRHNWPDALWLDEGRVRVDLGNTARGELRVALVEPHGDVEIVNELRPRRGSCADLRERPQLSLDEAATPLRAVITGEWSADCLPLRLEVAPLHIERFVATLVGGAWRAAGGQLDGEVVSPSPDLPPLVLPKKPWMTLESPPLAELIREMNKTSNNLLARNLMLSMADRFPNRPATLDGARKRVDQWLRKAGFDDEDLHVDNGSGLSYTERGRVRALVQLLQRAWASDTAGLFRESLPLAGKDGTMANRLRHLEGTEVLLKTGSLNQARALAGYVRGRSGRVYAMAAVINHAFAARGEPALDAFVEWIVKNG